MRCVDAAVADTAIQKCRASVVSGSHFSRPYSASIFGTLSTSALSGRDVRPPRRRRLRRLPAERRCPAVAAREDAGGEVQAAEGRIIQHDHHPPVRRPRRSARATTTKRTRRRQRHTALERPGRSHRTRTPRSPLHGHVAHPGCRRGENHDKTRSKAGDTEYSLGSTFSNNASVMALTRIPRIASRT